MVATITQWKVLASFLCIFRYLRLMVNLWSHWTFRSIAPPIQPQYTSEDVTVIVPTVDGDGDDLLRTIKSCLAARPRELILTTVDASRKRAEALVHAINSKRIRICSVARPNKRRQLCAAISLVSTDIIILADDDVWWPHSLMPWILAPFDDCNVGGVGTSQRLMRPDRPSLWAFLGSLYLERRNFDCSACVNIDGGLPCLSGRTVAYRSSMLRDPAFMSGFANETWRGKSLNADDDNFITRWAYAHGWQIRMQYHKACEVRTTLEDGPTYLSQCLRWVRSNWRSNMTSMFVERHYWWTQPWSTYAVLQTTFTAWALSDFVILYAIFMASQELQAQTQKLVLITAVLWIFIVAKTIKLTGHFVRYPADIFLLPISIIFGHIHGVIKLVGLLTLSATTWGSRPGADDDQVAATVSSEAEKASMPLIPTSKHNTAGETMSGYGTQ